MALEDRVQTRYGAQFLVELTNPSTTGATASSLNATTLAAAARDAETEFQARTGVAYDDDVAAHQAVAAEGVIYFLYLRAGKFDLAREARSEWNAHLDEFAKVLGRNRPRPDATSDGVISVSSEAVAGETVYNDFDRGRFGRIIPKKPGVV